jgi:hypothetical protein
VDAERAGVYHSAPMRPARLFLCAAALCFGGALALAKDGAEIPDARLPFNPADTAKVGDWAQYSVLDPAAPEERLPPERFTVAEVGNGNAVLMDTSKDVFRYLQGEPGKSATAFLRGFFGEARDDQISSLKKISVQPDGCEANGKRYEGVRIDAELVSVISAEEAGGKGGDMKSTFKVWIAEGVRGPGVVRADAAVEFMGRTHRGSLQLEAHGGAGDKPPPPRAPVVPTGTAAPERPAPQGPPPGGQPPPPGGTGGETPGGPAPPAGGAGH